MRNWLIEVGGTIYVSKVEKERKKPGGVSIIILDSLLEDREIRKFIDGKTFFSR